jgi:hypothetical protein
MKDSQGCGRTIWQCPKCKSEDIYFDGAFVKCHSCNYIEVGGTEILDKHWTAPNPCTEVISDRIKQLSWGQPLPFPELK